MNFDVPTQGKYGGEKRVTNLQYEEHSSMLIIMFDAHGQHI